MYKKFHPTLNNGRNYLSKLLKGGRGCRNKGMDEFAHTTLQSFYVDAIPYLCPNVNAGLATTC